VFVAAIFVVFVTSAVFAAEAPEGSTTITIVHTNDMHGRLFQSSSAIGLDTVAAIREATPNSILVDAGDTIHGLPFVTFNQGVNAIRLMNAAGYNFFTAGNHDFNFGAARLVELEGYAEFEFLATNLRRELEPSIITSEWTAGSVFGNLAIKEIDGVTVGFFGLVYPNTPSVTGPAGVVGLRFLNPVETARIAVEMLQAADVDVIVAISHLGLDGDGWAMEVARENPAIDVIIDGHSHSVLEAGYRVNDVLIAQAGGHGAFVGMVEIVVYEGEVLSTTASLIDRAASEAFTPVAEVTVLIEEMQDALGEVLNEVVAYSPITLFGDDPEHRPALRSSEVPIGNLIADAKRWAMDADLAIVNSGGIRYHIHAGDVTKGDIITVLAFFNYAVVVEITAAQLWEAMEIGVSALGHGRFPQVSGFSYVFDSNADAGNRITSITVNGTNLNRNDTTTTFSLVINDFTAVGGDDFTTFVGLPVLREGGTIDELLIEYMATFDISNTRIEGRIINAPAEETRPLDEINRRYVNGVPFVPIRATAEAYGAIVQWDETTRIVTIILNNNTITIDDPNQFLDGEISRVFVTYEYAAELFNR